ncbi:MAG: hypothetical protein H0V45_08855 [Actinobacteria bacterium]|nr:hypothetical protein [Actinomycetota bacterium]
MTTGVVAGLAVGLVFILANMIYATSQPALVNVPDGPKLPAIAPFLDIGTVFYFDDKPRMTPAYPFAGLITHFSLSLVFGLVFALVLVPLFSNLRALLAGAVVYGGPAVRGQLPDPRTLGVRVVRPFGPDGSRSVVRPAHALGLWPPTGAFLPDHGVPVRSGAGGARRGGSSRGAKARDAGRAMNAIQRLGGKSWG